MARFNCLPSGAAFALVVAIMPGAAFFSATGIRAQEFGHYSTEWREWPGELRRDKVFPLSIGAELLPTPPARLEVPRPRAPTPAAKPPAASEHGLLPELPPGWKPDTVLPIVPQEPSGARSAEIPVLPGPVEAKPAAPPTPLPAEVPLDRALPPLLPTPPTQERDLIPTPPTETEDLIPATPAPRPAKEVRLDQALPPPAKSPPSRSPLAAPALLVQSPQKESGLLLPSPPEKELNPVEPARPPLLEPAESAHDSTPTLENSGLLTAYVPADAKVTVNGLLTRRTGSERRFVSYRLKPGFVYAYEVRVEILRSEQVLEETRTISLAAGENAAVAFGFNRSPADLADAGDDSLPPAK
ncbi:MAG: TIGR03000 domain-containing protein [Thermoguttaceae bacterium]|jgi:uncharacterized protein (TIGR03000 family)